MAHQLAEHAYVAMVISLGNDLPLVSPPERSQATVQWVRPLHQAAPACRVVRPHTSRPLLAAAWHLPLVLAPKVRPGHRAGGAAVGMLALRLVTPGKR